MKLIKKIDNYLENKNYKIIMQENVLNINNFDEIVDFSLTKITVKCRDKILDIDGKDLIISRMVDREMMITGEIHTIRIN